MLYRLHTPKQHVAAGTYVVSGERREIIEACLGTCVGVALWDRHAQLGGMIHLLLPEPVRNEKVWRPANYASTGLPLFLEALCTSGAEHGRLEACVAGGGLIGPLSARDLDLDIGGRTTEIVEKILAREGIPIRMSETGGFITRRLSLNVETWESKIETAESGVALTGNRTFEKPVEKKLLHDIETLQPIPQIALKIIRMLRHENQSLRMIGQEIRKDQVLSAKVIRLCNSALFNLKMKIDSIDRALVVLGENRLFQFVLSASLEDIFPKSGLGYSFCKGGLYQHAMGTAQVTEILANFTQKAPPDIAYTAGLLHDIGKIVLERYMAPVSPLFYHRTQVVGDDLIDVEQEVLGITHPEVGRRLAAVWSLPAILEDVICHHHNPEEAGVNSELAHLVYLADLLMSRFVMEQEMERLDTRRLSARLARVGLNPEQFLMIIDWIPPYIFNYSQSQPQTKAAA